MSLAVLRAQTRTASRLHSRGFARRVTWDDGTETLGMTDKEVEAYEQKVRSERRKRTPRNRLGDDKEAVKTMDAKAESEYWKKWIGFLRLEDGPKFVDKRTPEQLEADKHFADTYAKLNYQRKYVYKQLEFTKMTTKWAAVHALPPRLREAALIDEDTLWPLTIPPLAHYPANYHKEKSPDMID